METVGNHIRLPIGKAIVERNSTLTWKKAKSILNRIGEQKEKLRKSSLLVATIFTLSEG
jgi:hypothetical protein